MTTARERREKVKARKGKIVNSKLKKSGKIISHVIARNEVTRQSDFVKSRCEADEISRGNLYQLPNPVNLTRLGRE